MNETELLIPKDFFRITCSELQHTKGEVYYNDINNKYFLIVDDKIGCGPLDRTQLEALLHATNDAYNQRGQHGRV